MAITLKEQQAKNLFLHTDQTQTEIADLLDIDRKTLHLWVKKGMWEQMKRSAEQTPSVILQNIHNHIYRINKKIADRDEDDQCPTMQEIEMLRKLVIMTKAFPQKHTGTYVEVFSEFMLYLVGQDNVLAKDVNQHIDRYISGVLQDENRDISGYARRVKENLDADTHFAERKPEPRKEEPKQQKQKTNPVKQNEQDHTLRNTSRSFEVPAAIETDDATHASHDNTVRNTSLSFGVPIAIGRGEVSVKNGEFQITLENVPNAATTPTHEPNDHAKNSPFPPSENLPENREFVEMIANKREPKNEVHNISLSEPALSYNSTEEAACPALQREGEGFPPEDWGTLPPEIKTMEPAKRPSPFRHNNTIWITHADDVIDSERKMSDTIRYYPDVDPVRAFDIKNFEFRIRQRSIPPQETPHQQAIAKTEQQYMQAQMIADFYHEMRSPQTRKNNKRW